MADQEGMVDDTWGAAFYAHAQLYKNGSALWVTVHQVKQFAAVNFWLEENGKLFCLLDEKVYRNRWATPRMLLAMLREVLSDPDLAKKLVEGGEYHLAFLSLWNSVELIIAGQE